MSPNIRIRHFVAIAITACLGGPSGAAEEAAPVAGQRTPQVCPGCGIVNNIRLLDKPVARERATLPSITSSPSVGGMGNTVQTVPLLSIGKDGAHRVPREPATQRTWEVTVRYDNGSFGFVTLESEPDLKVGDRVRHVENTLEMLGPPPR
jgi:hypothetical protein